MLDRAITLVEAVVQAGRPVGPRALARDTGIDRSAVSRILRQLSALGVLATEDGTYHPGGRLFTIGRALSAQDTLQAAASAVLAGLVAEYDETSYVCTLHGQSVVFLYECQSSKPVRYVVELGKPVPLHAGAAGRAILLGLPEPEARELLESGPLVALTDATVTDVDTLLEMRREDVGRGYSISREERVEGGAAVAAPFFDASGACRGSVVLTCPLTRYRAIDGDAVGRSVHAAATLLSARLGAVAQT
jgi:DNA-binding IclR family transcriptional regulator